jgi:hypothetical protein
MTGCDEPYILINRTAWNLVKAEASEVRPGGSTEGSMDNATSEWMLEWN